ncbi:hypothetical protein K402DRAFT_417193 [Aulographum hederae CBS 113979]|uniref:Uncharacterized protein n=1 Tax=Aulographum hederae CBS 113979 TaxID=1176131 RepID=A0A6G1HDK9_9PEZI|nr:hypothetical protein K402DRAFT_417193 [Aulographum hederae CBS 113979]
MALPSLLPRPPFFSGSKIMQAASRQEVFPVLQGLALAARRSKQKSPEVDAGVRVKRILGLGQALLATVGTATYWPADWTAVAPFRGSHHSSAITAPRRRTPVHKAPRRRGLQLILELSSAQAGPEGQLQVVAFPWSYTASATDCPSYAPLRD